MQLAHRPYRRLSRRKRTKGAELVEFTFTFIPWLAMIFFICNTAWAVYCQATLQTAVRLAVRKGVTLTGAQTTNLTASVKSLVQANSMGMLNGSTGLNYIKVHYFDQDSPSTDVSNTSTGNKSGNVMQVSIEGYPLNPLFSRIYTLRGSVDHNPMNIFVYSADLIEPSNNTPPIGSAP
jgi:Flp pilus assembly protein TadG